MKSKTYSLQFWLLCFSSFLFFASFNMIIPELPAFLSNLGGEDYKGFIISLFTLTAGLSRPFSGKLTDRIGRIPVMIFGAAVCFALGFVYPFVTTVLGFFVLRLVHGFSTGFKPTGTVAYVADIVPVNRRGEAMGLNSFFGTTGMALGATIGSEIALQYSTTVMFIVSSVFAIFSIIILAGMKETLENKEPFQWRHLRIGKNEIFDKQAMPPSVVMFLTVFSFGIVLTVIPDFSVHLGLGDTGTYFLNKGTFNTIFVMASMAVRIFAGKISDKWGREPVLLVATCLYMLSLIIIGFSYNTTMFFSGAVLYGLGVGMNSPTLFAWTADLCEDKNRGLGMATTFIALEAGIMLGAITSGYVYNNDPSNFPATFAMGAITALIGFLFLIFRMRKKHFSVNN